MTSEFQPSPAMSQIPQCSLNADLAMNGLTFSTSLGAHYCVFESHKVKSKQTHLSSETLEHLFPERANWGAVPHSLTR